MPNELVEIPTTSFISTSKTAAATEEMATMRFSRLASGVLLGRLAWMMWELVIFRYEV